MSGDRGLSFPIATASVVAMLVSATLGGHYALDSLRLGESDAVDRRLVLDLPVEARLWEDPFVALGRYRNKVCPLEAKQGVPPDPRCLDKEVTSAALRARLDKDGTLTVIAALLPGARFVGAEEGRRRMRYAVLAGLGAEGFVPDDSEHMGLLRDPLCASFAECKAPVLRPLVAPQTISPEIDKPAGKAGAEPESRQEAGNGALLGDERTVLDAPMTGPAPLDSGDGKPPANRPTGVEVDTSSRANIDIPYELFVEERSGGKADPPGRVIVLWVDDTKVGRLWLRTLAILLNGVAPSDRKDRAVRLRIIGPHTSDNLVDALGDLSALVGQAAGPVEQSRQTFLLNMKALARLQLVNPFSTATANRVREAVDSARPVGSSPLPPCVVPPGAQNIDCVDEAFRARLTQLASLMPDPDGSPLPHVDRFFVRAIGSDDGLIDLLVTEVCQRGLGDGQGGQLVLLREWDSLYARTFARTLEARLARTQNCGTGDKAKKLSVRLYSYLRGLDGATVEGAARQQRLLPQAGEKSRDQAKEPNVEWPESRDQRDYVRRLVRHIGQDADHEHGAIRAIGIIGSDVHDKLILAKALRGAFADRTLFTTDLDARLLHPDASKAARNLVVASSLSLVPEGRSTIGIAPFRDVYQTATFLGVRYAASNQLAIIEGEKRDLLFEVGNDGQVELGTNALASDEAYRRRVYGAAGIAALISLGLLMLVGCPAPAMKAALSAGKTPVGFGDAMVSGFTVAGWSFGIGVMLELGWPQMVGPDRMTLLIATSTLGFWALTAPGVRATPAGDARAAALAAIAAVAIPLWVVMPPRDDGMHEPFAVLSGVSAWPGQLFRTVAVVLFTWFLDFTWNRSNEATQAVGEKYFGIKPASEASWPNPGLAAWDATVFPFSIRWQRTSVTPRWRRLVRVMRAMCRRVWRKLKRGTGESILAASVWFWRPDVERGTGEIDGTALWCSYLRLLRNWSRLGRLALWLPAIIAVVTIEMFLIGAEPPDIPARALADRALFWATILMSVLGTVILLILVGDVTVLSWRVISIFKNGRTIYPKETIRHFAILLGSKDPAGPQVGQDLWMKPIHACFESRCMQSGKPRNSLLDDWIDAKLLAEHTAKVGPLIVYPFILLALVIVARSSLFDNWAANGAVLLALATYLLWAVAMVTMLNIGAEIARRDAVENMRADLRWMQGAGGDYEKVSKQFEGLIDDVVHLREGAFAPFFEQPLLRAVLVPLGGAGSMQLLEIFVFGR